MMSDIRGINNGPVVTSRSCQDPPIRREWRTLWKEEKKAYIAAVLCLTHKKSILQDLGSLYDDFVWVHQIAGQEGKLKSIPFRNNYC